MTTLCRVLALVVLACGLMTAAGCRDKTPTGDEPAAEDSSGQWREHDFSFAIDNLYRLERFAGGEMRHQMIIRLNQWIRFEKLPPGWKVDPLAADVPGADKLDELSFTSDDGLTLQEAVWFRDLSQWTQGKSSGELARAESMFDWVVRNIQLSPGAGSEPGAIAQFPGETLLWGKGTAVDRAWIFMLMLRQQGIESALLALPAADDGKKLEPWAVGVLVDKKVYLFDPALGLPIPAADGVKYEDKKLLIEPATLSQVIEQPALLRELDAPGHPYPVDEKRLAGVVALLEGSPSFLAARMRLIESRLTGDQRLVLTTNPSAVAEQFKQVSHLSDVRLWRWPYEVIAARAQLSDEQRQKLSSIELPFKSRHSLLRKGRVAYLKGRFADEQGAMAYYLEARPSKRNFVAMKRRIADEPDPERAARMREKLEAQVRGKSDATYWIGLLEVAEDRPTVAADYFSKRSMIKPWRQGARYNLGRIAETLGSPKQAAAIYRTAPPSPARHGFLVRAKWLDPSGEKDDQPAAEDPAKEDEAKDE